MPARINSQTPVIKVNLLPQDPFMDSVVGKFLLWSLSIGRYIVIFTELIVIMTFLSRFALDRRLTDLNEQINRQKNIIQSYQDTEERFLEVQSQLSFLSTKQQNAVVMPTLTSISKLLPIDVRLTRLAVQPTGWNISAQALSAQGIKSAVDQIVAQYPSFEVSVNSVKLDSRVNAIVFDLSSTQKVKQTEKVQSNSEKSSDKAEF